MTNSPAHEPKPRPLDLAERRPKHVEEAGPEEFDLYIVLVSTQLTPSQSMMDLRRMTRARTFQEGRRRRNRLPKWLETVRTTLCMWFIGPQQQVASLGLLVAAFAAIAGLLK